MIEPTGPNQTQPESTVSSEAGLEEQSSLPATLVSERRGERERTTHETNSSLSALSSPTDLGSGVGVCVHTGPAGETEVMWPEQHFFTYISVQS